MRRFMTWALALLISAPLLAQAAAQTPHQVVEDTSVRVMETLNANRELYKQDADAFYNGLNEIMEPVVDFQGIARSVMTVRYSRSATPGRWTASSRPQAQHGQFCNALLEFDGGSITVLPRQWRPADRGACQREWRRPTAATSTRPTPWPTSMVSGRCAT